jgi:hypothetical protein
MLERVDCFVCFPGTESAYPANSGRGRTFAFVPAQFAHRYPRRDLAGKAANLFFENRWRCCPFIVFALLSCVLAVHHVTAQSSGKGYSEREEEITES